METSVEKLLYLEAYDCLVNDVAGPLVDYRTHIDTALDEAKRLCFEFYEVKFEELLALVGKTEADLKKDAILRARNWNIEKK